MAMVSVGDTLPFPKEADFLASHSSYEDLPRLTTHRTISAPGRCVVVAIARNSASTSNVSCRNIDNSGNGEGEPFQLRKLENRSFWENEEVTNEGLKVGCLLEYGVVRGSCVQGEGDEEQFIFHRNAGAEPQDVDKILLDLQDDESVYGGLRKALINNISKRMVKVLLEVQNMFNANYELLVKMCECINPERVVKVILEVQNMIAYYELLVKMREYINPEDVDKILLDLQDDERVYGGLTKALINNISKRMGEVMLEVQNLFTTYHELLVKMCECINLEKLAKVEWNVRNLFVVYGEPLVKTREYFNSKFYRLQGHSAYTRIFFIGIRAGTLHNERVTLETMSGEWFDMLLNCRENLVLSTGPVHLQLKRPWDVADDGVGGVAVVKCEAGEATCEGLILRCKPLVISRDKEPVGILNGSGKVIPVTGRVLFDTGNEAATCITTELLLELNLQPGSRKKRKVGLPGGEIRKFEIIQIEPVIRGYHFPVSAIIDATPVDAALLVGMDIIEKLFDLGYTIGPSCSKEKKEKKKEKKEN